MKNCLIALFVLLAGNTAHAADGSGTIDDIMICTGDHLESSNGLWIEMGLFKTSDGNWFGTWINNTGGGAIAANGDYRTFSSSTNGLDSIAIYETAKDAFFANQEVSVRANFGVYTVCGVTANFMRRTAGDFIRMTKTPVLN